AIIRLADGASAELAPLSELVLHPGRAARQVVELGRGRGTFHAGKSGRRLRVDTPLGSISGLGAAFSVELQPEDEEGVEPMTNRSTVVLIVAALVGSVEVHSAGHNYLLASGQSKVFAPGKAPLEKPAFSGKVVEVAADGKAFTLE